MLPFTVYEQLCNTASYLLPSGWNRWHAFIMLRAIGLQESAFENRRQLVMGADRRLIPSGPAVSFFQFELGQHSPPAGLTGLLQHPVGGHIVRAAATLQYPAATPEELWLAIRHNDVLAIVCARVLLYTHPRPLPLHHEDDEAWEQYYWCWRPGRPRRDAWKTWWNKAWAEYKMVHPTHGARPS